MKSFFVLLSFLSLSSFAGNERGNGGNAVVCRNTDGTIRSAELLDLYEGRALQGLDYDALAGTVEDNYSRIIESSFGILPPEERLKFDLVKNSFKMLPPGVALESIADSRQIIVPRDCKIEQVANSYNALNIFVVSDIYNHFSDLDRLGLLLHEAFYHLDRHGQIVDSRYTRRVVAQILSKSVTIEPITDGIDRAEDFLCTSYAHFAGQSAKETRFWAKDLTGNRWRLQFEKLNGHQVYSKKTAIFDFGAVTFPLDVEVGDELGLHSFTTDMNSQVEGSESISIVINKGRLDTPMGSWNMLLDWSGFDPDDRVTAYFRCSREKDLQDPQR